MTSQIIVGDCLAEMRELEDASIDAIVSDPPYGLGFMGKEWDDLPPGLEFAVEALRVLKPGGHLLAFGGTRTYHRLAVAIEDAGFEIRDCLMWLYGSGFPKSLNVGKAIDKKRYDLEEALQVTTWINEQVKLSSKTHKELLDAFGFNKGSGQVGHWTATTKGSQPAVPTLDQVPKLLEVLGVDPDDVPEEIRRLLYELNGKQGQPGKNWFKREVVGKKKSSLGGTVAAGERDPDFISEHRNKEVAITAPATEAAKQWEGWGTALKPANEPIVLARKPLEGTVAANVQKWGTGALNIDGCRIGYEDGEVDFDRQQRQQHSDGAVEGAFGAAALVGSEIPTYKPNGRWPANLAFDETAAEMLDEQSGERPGGSYPKQRGAAVATGFGQGQPTEGGARQMGDTGGASRFFYCAKTSKAERNAGLNGIKDGTVHRYGAGIGEGKNPDAPSVERNVHPTVKPIDLMRWLVRLVTPPNGTVLDPFLGSGTTGIAAHLEGFDFVGIEREAEYAEIAQARIDYFREFDEGTETKDVVKGKRKPTEASQMSIEDAA